MSTLEVKQLAKLYRSLCSRAAELPPELVEKLDCPYFVRPRDGWYSATHRILMVGQEPRNWGFDAEQKKYDWHHPPLWSLRQTIQYESSAEALMDAYKAHNYEKRFASRNDAYERAFNLMMSFANRGELGDVVKTNVFKCTLQTADPKSRSPLNGVPHDLRQILDWQHGCLTEEIRILRPTSIVFFTGPNYDKALVDEFPGLQLAAVGDHRSSREFARVIHDALPERSFRTYHPGHLARAKRWSLGDEIIAKVC